MLKVIGLRHRRGIFAKNTEDTYQAKNLGDIAVALLILAFSAPLLIIVALAIKYESPGPVLSVARRLRPDGRTYLRLRFRTTAQCANLHDILKDRDRVTRVGQFLRTSRIEHLPQVVNVLRQEIALREIDLLAD